MAGPRSIKEIREANGGLSNLTDFEIAQHEFKRAGKYYDSFNDFAKDVGVDTGGKWGNRLSASVDSWQAGLQGVGEAVAGSMGLSGTEDIFRRSRRANEVEAQNARQLAQSQGAVMSYKDANSLGDYADWAGGLAVDSLPYLGEALVGGIAGRALLTGGRLGLSRAAAGQVGTTMASYPSAVGDILQNQRDENGTTDLGSAAVGGVPYALANGLFGIEGAIGRGSLARSGFAALDDLTGVRGALARTGATAGRNALSEGMSETAQEGVNQYFGRMAVNPDETLFNPEANDRYLESFVGGATLGGLVGGGAGGWRRSEGYTAPTVDDPAKPTNLLGGTPPNLVTDMGALPPLQDRINQNLGLNLTGAPKGYADAFVEAYDMPSGVRLPDPETGVERELSMGELRELQAAQNQAEIGGLTGDTAGLPPTAPINLVTDTSALLPLQQRIDQNLGLNLPGAPKNYPSQFQEAASEPTNQWVVDPQTGMEHRLDIGQVTAIRAGDNTQLTPEQQNIKAKADELAAARTAAHNTFMGPAVDGAWPLKLQPREVSTYRAMDQLRQQGAMSQAAFEEMAGSVQEALMAEDTKTLNKINKDITAELAKRQAPAQEQAQGDTPSTQQTAPAAQPTGLQLNFGDEATAVPGEAKPAPVVGLQRKATAPTTPVEPATPVATEAQPTAPVAGTSPAADAWQRVVAQAQALQIPVPPYESLRADQQKQVEDLVAREQFNMSAADTVLRMPEPAAKPAPAVGLQRKATAPTTPFVPAAEEQVAAPAAPVEPATPVAAEGQPAAGTAPIRRAKPAPAAAVATAFRAAKSELKPVVVEANAAAAKQLKALKSLRPNQSNRPKDPEAAAEYDRKMAEFNAAIPNRADVERGLLDVFLTTTDDRRISWIEKATGYFVDTSSGVPVLRQNNQPATNAQIAEEELFEGGIEGKVLSEEDKKALRAADSNISKWLTSRGLYKEVIDRLGAPTDTKEYSDAELGINSAEDAAAVGIQVFDDATKASGNVSLSEKYHKRVKFKVDLELKALEAAGFSEDAIKAAYARLNGLTYKDTDEATAGEVVQDAEGEFADAVGLDATEQNPDGAVVDPDTADTARDSKYNPYTAALAEALADQLLVKRKQRTRVDTGDVKLTQAEIEQRKFDSVKAAAQAVRAAVGSMGFSESVASWNDLRSDDAPEFDNLPVVRQAAWVSSYKSFFEDLARGHITEDQFRSAVESEQRSFEAGAVFQQEAELERRVLARRLGANRPDGAGPAGSGVAAPQIDSNADVGTRAKAKLKSVQQNVAKADLTDEELEWAAQTFERLKNTAKAKEARAEQQKRAPAAPVDQAKAVEQAPATAAAPAAQAAASEPALLNQYNPDEGPSVARSEGQAEQRSAGGSQPGQSDLFYPNGEPTYGADATQKPDDAGLFGAEGHPEWATYWESRTGGPVVFSNENLALVTGYNMLNGQAVYAGIHRQNGYIGVDVDSLTPSNNAFDASDMQTLRDAKRRVVAADEAKLAENPEGPFSGADVAASKSFQGAELGYLRGLLNLLNIDGLRVFLLNPDDVRNNRDEYKLHGAFSSAGSAGLDAGEDGSMRKFGTRAKDFYISVRGGMPAGQTLETIAHEVGHIVQRVAFDTADVPTKNEIIREFNAWFDAHSKKPLKDIIPELRNRDSAAAHAANISPDAKPSSYWVSFSEWFADNVSRWATTSAKPMSLVDTFFKAVADTIRKLATAASGKKFLPNPKVAEFLDRMAASSSAVGLAHAGREAAFDPTNPDIRYSKRALKTPDGGFGAAERGTAPGETKVGYIHTTTDKQAFMDAYPGVAAAVRGLEGLGLRHIWDRVASIHVTDENTLQADGALAQAPDGSIQLWIDRDFLTSQSALRDLINHELGGHLVDGAYGSDVGKFSRSLKWQVQLKGGKVTPIGAIARELNRLAATNEAWNDLLAYPLTENKDMDAQRVSEELFAQMAALYIANPTVVANRAPLTAAALQEAFKRETITKSESVTKHKPRPTTRTKSVGVPQDASGGDAEVVERDGRDRARVSRRNQKGASKTGAKPSYLSKAPSELADLASGIATSVKDWTFTRGAFTRDLLDAAAKLMPSASKYLDRMQRARVESVKLEREVAAILDDAAALSATERGTGDGSVNSLIRDMTYDGKWAFKPDWLSGVTPDPVLEARFNQLSDKAQDVVMRVFRHGHETLKQVQQAATDSIKSEVEPLIAKARAEGDMKTVKELEREKVKADGKFRRLLAIRGGMPYAPLRRFGNWAVVVKSKMYQDAQARGDKGEMGRLASDGNHYRVEFVPNRLVAAGRANRLREVVGDSSVEFFERSDARLLYGGDSMFSAFSRFRELARQEMEDGEPEVVAALDKTLASMYMALVAETSARTSEFDRKNVAGADKDMLRSFATHGRAMANFIGSLKTSGEVMDTLRVMKREAGEGSSLAEKSTLYSEILRRHSVGLNYEPNQLLDKSLAANSYWSLVTSPSYLLTNLTQPWVVSLPVLAGRFGMGRSSSEMFRAYKEIGRISSRLVDNPDAVKDLPKDVQGAVEELFNRGSIDISLGADLGAFTSGGDSKLSANIEKAIRFPRTLVERGEMVNRVATAVAAYRLAKSQGLKDEAAINYADKVIYETHGDYSAFNSPRVMRNAVGRFATQFRKFQLIQIALYGRMIRDSLAKLPTKGTQDELKAAAEARAVARRSLAYTLGTTFALGGLTALPGFTAISFLMGAFGDDDEPDDPEATLRRALGGGAEADLLMRGVPNLLGMNLGNRIGAAGMLSILPYTDLEASREGYKDILMGVAGPFFGGTLPKALDGLGLIRQGDLWKGLEMLAPRGLADVSKGIRFGTEGVTKRNGDVVLSGDDVSFFAVVAQAMGLPTTTITDNQMLRNSQFTADEFYKDRTGQLKRQYVQAYRSGDGAKLREIRAEWQETQQARRRLGFKVQPLSTLLKAPQEQRKREAKPLNMELVE